MNFVRRDNGGDEISVINHPGKAYVRVFVWLALFFFVKCRSKSHRPPDAIIYMLLIKRDRVEILDEVRVASII